MPTLRQKVKDAGAPGLLTDYLFDKYEIKGLDNNDETFDYLVNTLKKLKGTNANNYPQHYFKPMYENPSIEVFQQNTWPRRPGIVGAVDYGTSNIQLPTHYGTNAGTLAHEGFHAARQYDGQAERDHYDLPRAAKYTTPPGTDVGHSGSYNELMAALNGTQATLPIGQDIVNDPRYSDFLEGKRARRKYEESKPIPQASGANALQEAYGRTRIPELLHGLLN